MTIIRRPPSGIASRALVARLVRLASSCAGSTTTGQTSGAEVERNLDVFAERPAQQPGDPGDQLVDVDALRPERLLAREGEQAAGQIGAAECRVERLVRQLVDCRRRPFFRSRSRSRLPMMTPSILLKSCAMPPVRLPIASIFWAWCSCASSLLRSICSRFWLVRSRRMPVK